MKPCTIKDYQLWCNGQWVIIYIARYFNSAYTDQEMNYSNNKHCTKAGAMCQNVQLTIDMIHY